MGFSYHSGSVLNGELYMWGSNVYGQCGIGNTTNVRVPTRVGTDKDWSYVVTGQHHTIAIKKDGSLWAWGYNANGRLGTGNTTQQLEPVRISTDKWIKVTTGYAHNIGLKSDGTIWSWGDSNYGELGHGNTTQQLEPTQIGTDNDWVEIGCGGDYSMAIKKDGSLWTWGYNAYGNLGHGDVIQYNIPKKVNIDDEFAKVTGCNNTTVAINKNGVIYGCGRNYYGELGQGHNTASSVFYILNDLKFKDVACTINTFFYLDNENNLWGAGRNNYGEMGLGNVTAQRTITLLQPNVSAVACGYDYSTYLKKGSNRIYMSGYNASYQLGLNHDSNINTHTLMQNFSYNTIHNNFEEFRRDIVLNADISPANIWYEDDVDFRVQGTINEEYGTSAQYKVLLNDIQVYPETDDYSDVQSTPINFDISTITKDDLTVGHNILKLDIKYTNNFNSIYEFDVNLENRDTTIFHRSQSYSYEWNHNDSIIREDGLLKLSNVHRSGIVETSNLNEIKTIGKRKINDFIVNGSGDSIEQSEILQPFHSNSSLDGGKLYSMNIQPSNYTDILDISPMINFSSGNGTSENPYIIRNPIELSNIRFFLNDPNVHFVLGANINLDVYPYNTTGWTPIGDANWTNRFMGNLDGNGFSIIGLYIDTTVNDRGLFCWLDGATIKNLKFIDVNIKSTAGYIGTVCARHRLSTFENILTEGNMEVSGSYKGGLTGYDYNDSVFIECGTRMDITSSNSYTGGISGRAYYSTFKRCFFEGSITSTVTTSHIAGIGAYGYYSQFIDCYSKGQIKSLSSTYVAGITGYLNHAIAKTENCYVSTNITSISGNYRGGVVGRLANGATVTDSYWDKETTGLEVSAGSLPSNGLTTEEMKQLSTYMGYDSRTKENGELVWIFPDNDYPTLNREELYVKIIVQSDASYYTVKNGNWEKLNGIAILSKDVFLEKGVYAIPANKLSELNNPTIYVWSNNDLDLNLYLNVISSMKMRFLISRDGKLTWHSFTSGSWKQILPQNIKNQGMTLDEINNIPIDELNKWFRRGKLNLMIYFESQSIASSPTFSDFTVTFPSNEAPIIKNVKMTPETIVRNNAVLTANIEDLEGDSFRYQILLNGKSVMNTSDGWSNWTELDEKVNIYRLFNFTDFLSGSNAISIIAEDDRGLQYIADPLIVELSNTAPVFSVFTYDNWSLTGTVIDDDNDKIQYRILINDVQVFPKNGTSTPTYSKYFSTPKNIRYVWNSDDLIYGQSNKVAIEIRDEMGAIFTQTIDDIVGRYKGLMFKNKDGEYYSTDKGDILKFLDYGIIVAGQITEPRKVILENNLGFSVDGLTVQMNPPTTGYNVYLSKHEFPFISLTELTYDENIIHDGEAVEFYVQVSSSTSSSSTGGTFEIKAKAKPV